jgi:hypothetical protein
VPTLPPPPTETPQPKQKHIALGLSDHLGEFYSNLLKTYWPQNIEVHVAATWDLAHLSDVPAAGSTFELALEQAATRAEHIHFNLEGIVGDLNDWALQRGGHGMVWPFDYTAIELYHIKTRGHCLKTTFYDNGGTSLVPSQRWSEVCGNR